MQKEKNKILFVLEGFFPYQKAGTEVYVLNLSRYLKGRGYAVSILISRTDNTKDYTFEDIPVYTFKVPEKPIASELNGRIPPRGMDHFLSRVSEIKPDIVHFHSLGRAINSYHIEAVKAHAYKTVFTAHLANNICIRGDFLKFGKKICSGKISPFICLACKLHQKGYSMITANLGSAIINGFQLVYDKWLPASLYQASHRKNEIKRLKNHVDRIIAIAPWIQKVFEINKMDSNLILVEQATDVPKKSSKKTFSLKRNGSLIMGYIGRMHPIKGFHLLKEALDNLKNKNWMLHVFSMPSDVENAYFDKHKSWAETKQNIYWYEGISKDRLIDEIDKLDLIIVPSLSEMAPLVIREAFARKIPVLAANIPATKDLIKDGVNGLLFESNNSDSLRIQLERVLNSSIDLSRLTTEIPAYRSFSDLGKEMEHVYLELLKSVD